MTADPAWYLLLKDFARTNRGSMTEAEMAMWKILKSYFKAYRFRKQHLIGDYIADFASLRLMLVIEVDGGYHNEEEQMRMDAVRTEFLENHGFEVIRFTNDEVLSHPDQVKDKLISIIDEKNF